MEIRVKKSIGLSQDATDILRLEFIEVALYYYSDVLFYSCYTETKHFIFSFFHFAPCFALCV